MKANYLIVVGVDGSQGGSRALEWAAREAAVRGGAVQAVLAWSRDDIEPGPRTVISAEQERTRAAQVLDREVKAWVTRHGSHLPVTAEVVEGRLSDVLTDAGRAADLIVLGSHGNSRMPHTVPGSATEECIRKATCPVVVIPAAGRPGPVSAAAPTGRAIRPDARRPTIAPNQRTRPIPTVIRPGRGVW